MLVIVNSLREYWISTAFLEVSRCYANNFNGRRYSHHLNTNMAPVSITKRNMGQSYTVP